MGDKQVIPAYRRLSPFGQRQPFGIEIHRLSGAGCIVVFALLFELFLNAASYLGQAFSFRTLPV